jgi:cob(I)alamin adenosyltransferase
MSDNADLATRGRPTMTPSKKMHQVDELFSHVWMVRTFLKHSDEVQDDEELNSVHRTLYDVMLALGGPLKDNDPDAYFKKLDKKLTRLKQATELFVAIQPEVSNHTNFQMAAQSLAAAVRQIEEVARQSP